MQDTKGLKYSAILHGVMLLFMIFGLPEFLEPRPIPEPMAMSVDILPIAPISNVKPQEKTPEKPEPKKPVEEKETKQKATPEAKKEEAKKPDAVPLLTPVKKPEPKKPEKPKEIKNPEKKKVEDDLDSILKSVKDTAKADVSKKPTKKAPSNQHEAKSDRYDPTMQLSMSETDAIRQQFEKCWDVPAGAKDAQNLVITLAVRVNQDGSVQSVEMKKDRGRYASDSFFRAAADSAMRAVHICSPLKNLPAGKYDTWGDMELTFDPRNMLY